VVPDDRRGPRADTGAMTEHAPVLLATDGSPSAQAATEKAIELARLLDAKLLVATVWDIPYSAIGYAPVPLSADFDILQEDKAHEVTAQAVAQAEAEGVAAESAVLRGIPSEEIRLAAERFEPQLLVMGSHGWGPVRRMLLGSVSTGVLRRVTCPTLIVRGPKHEQSAHESEHAKAEA